jgi:hypothetical protein
MEEILMKIPVDFQFRAILILALFLIALVGLKGEEPAAQQQPVVEEQQESEAQTSKQPGSKASMMDELSCETCHGTLKEVAANTTRLYPSGTETDAGKEASRDEAFAFNPHESHYGDMECTQCHKDGETTLYCNTCHSFQVEPRNAMVSVSDEGCLKCHESYEKMAKDITNIYPPIVNTEIRKSCTKWEAFPVNPHESHYGDMKCTQCHSIHGESRLYCNTCHDFKDIDVP